MYTAAVIVSMQQASKKNFSPSNTYTNKKCGKIILKLMSILSLKLISNIVLHFEHPILYSAISILFISSQSITDCSLHRRWNLAIRMCMHVDLECFHKHVRCPPNNRAPELKCIHMRRQNVQHCPCAWRG
jgi:hypothetical protein